MGVVRPSFGRPRVFHAVSIYPLGTCRQLRTSRGSRVYGALLIERQSLVHQTTSQKRTGDTLPLEVTAPIVVWVRAKSRIPLVGSRNARPRCVRSAARCTDREERPGLRSTRTDAGTHVTSLALADRSVTSARVHGGRRAISFSRPQGATPGCAYWVPSAACAYWVSSEARLELATLTFSHL